MGSIEKRNRVVTKPSSSTSRSALTLSHARLGRAPKMPVAALIAGAIAASGFSIALIAGLLSHNTTSEIFFRATVALAACALAGLAIGLVFEWLVQMELARLETAATEIIHAQSGQNDLASTQVESENVQASSSRNDTVTLSSKKSGR